MKLLPKYLLLLLCSLAILNSCSHEPEHSASTAQTVAITDLTTNDIGKPIVVIAQTPTQVTLIGSEPPPGMITTKGDTTVYRGQLSQIVQNGIRIRAPFPHAPDTFKSVGISAKDIKSIEFTK